MAEGKAGKQTSSETRSQMAEPRPGSQKQHRNEKVGSGDMQASGEGFEIDAKGADSGLKVPKIFAKHIQHVGRNNRYISLASLCLSKLNIQLSISKHFTQTCT